MSGEAELSKLLWECRENVSMWADVVQRQRGFDPGTVRALVNRIDAYRAARGWSPHGFGSEAAAGPTEETT